MKTKTAVIIALIPIFLLIIFYLLLIFNDLCWHAAEAKGLNPNDMIYLTPEETVAFGNLVGSKPDGNPPLVTVHFREHFRCHSLEKPQTPADYPNLIAATIRATWGNTLGN